MPNILLAQGGKKSLSTFQDAVKGINQHVIGVLFMADLIYMVTEFDPTTRTVQCVRYTAFGKLHIMDINLKEHSFKSKLYLISPEFDNLAALEENPELYNQFINSLTNEHKEEPIQG